MSSKRRRMRSWMVMLGCKSSSASSMQVQMKIHDEPWTSPSRWGPVTQISWKRHNEVPCALAYFFVHRPAVVATCQGQEIWTVMWNLSIYDQFYVHMPVWVTTWFVQACYLDCMLSHLCYIRLVDTNRVSGSLCSFPFLLTKLVRCTARVNLHHGTNCSDDCNWTEGCQAVPESYVI